MTIRICWNNIYDLHFFPRKIPVHINVLVLLIFSLPNLEMEMEMEMNTHEMYRVYSLIWFLLDVQTKEGNFNKKVVHRAY